MRERMQEMQDEMQAFVDYVQREISPLRLLDQERIQNALVRVAPPYLNRTRAASK
jgi:hypothetical protein